MGNCVAKTLRFCVCVWKATKFVIQTLTTLRTSPKQINVGFIFGLGYGLRWLGSCIEKEKSEDHDHMRTKSFSRESWSWSSFFSSSGADFQRTMTICVARLLRGNLGHGHRLFLSHAFCNKKAANLFFVCDATLFFSFFFFCVFLLLFMSVCVHTGSAEI